MARVRLVVEGITEERFVKTMLAEPLGAKGIFLLPQMVHTGGGSERIYKGGVTSYQRIKSDVTKLLKQESQDDAFVTTMFDLYRLPNDFPGRVKAKPENDPLKKAAILENAFAEDIGAANFIPYVQLHEFEALLFTDITKLTEFYVGAKSAVESLASSVEGIPPEHIDEGQQTAPSKRIIEFIPEYERTKATGGVIVATKIGLDAMLNSCQHFGRWFKQLESLKAG
ncbi:MAG TPA: DUF4276 family protein [Candidatus Sulfotelmatobacter sp.]|nr:DUF4276 family protein [Candidatus Sulfotelmatobacter sp.]